MYNTNLYYNCSAVVVAAANIATTVASIGDSYCDFLKDSIIIYRLTNLLHFFN